MTKLAGLYIKRNKFKLIVLDFTLIQYIRMEIGEEKRLVFFLQKPSGVIQNVIRLYGRKFFLDSIPNRLECQTVELKMLIIFGTELPVFYILCAYSAAHSGSTTYLIKLWWFYTSVIIIMARIQING